MQRSTFELGLTGIYFDHKSVEQSEKNVIRCNAPTSAVK